uniref:non-specific serine/threonine protein kinase n=1 Tax=Leersia perrieri TaxID=77586 RepID=A0A0D9WAH8_9ORYZ
MNRFHVLHILQAITILSRIPLSAGDHRSILWRGDSIAVSNAAGGGEHVLVSPSGEFSCGFYKVATNAYTFAVWFTSSADATVAWMANRDAPVNGVGSRAELRKDGSLVLQDYDGHVVWSTNTTGTTADRVNLLDTGNLVVSDAGGDTLWQSFDWPTDTLLAGQPMTRYRQLVSASARGLPYSGYYKFYFDSNNILNLMYDGPEISSNYWPDPFNKWWENNRTAFNSSRLGGFDTRGVFTASDQLQFNASDAGDVRVLRRLTLDYDGNVGVAVAIAVRVAKALAYLHHECLEWIMHRDVKPENILLDTDFEPKVTDFGLVKLLARDATATGTHLSRVQGTRGYIAPECWMVGRPVTGKADVYSFGVVLLELLRGQRVCDWAAGDLQQLASWIKERLKRDGDDDDGGEVSAWVEEEVMDARLRGDFSHVQAVAMLELAISCVDGEPNRRPSMNAVAQKLISLHDRGSSMRFA